MNGYRVVFPHARTATLEAFEVPPAPAGSVLIETEYSVVSAGTVRANLPGMPNTSGRFPFFPGYSAVGRIVDRGTETAGLACGDRVIVYHGGHQSYSVMHDADLAKDPLTSIGIVFDWHDAAASGKAA